LFDLGTPRHNHYVAPISVCSCTHEGGPVNGLGAEAANLHSHCDYVTDLHVRFFDVKSESS
jgi:hypothetical protein